MASSIVSVSILICMTFIYRIKFGKTNVTKITLLAYYRALLFLTYVLVVCIYYLVMSNWVYTGNEFFEHFLEQNYIWKISMCFEGIKLCFFFTFIFAVQFEYMILDSFIAFQNAFRLEHLEIVKSQYHNIE